MDIVMLQQLAKKLRMTNYEEEQEPYILTKDEEDILFDNAVQSIKDWHYWKMVDLKMAEGDIEQKLSQMDFKGMVRKEELFANANSSKNYELWQKENRRKEKEEEVRKRRELQETWTAKRMYQLMKWASKNTFDEDFVLNEHNEKLIKALCFFVSRDDRFKSELKFSTKKGLCIRGKSGIGKTHLVRCLESNPLNSILTLSMLDITEEVKDTGQYEIQMGNNRLLYLDDVGTEEPVVKHYGTNISWFKNFIETIYLKQSQFANLIISTNNSFAEIQEKYGFRVRSRFKDMFNVIDISGEDMRG